ncbi:unnamed protein product [Zymoseptoria tritici ST99CH_3D7]|uniref:AAA+ ATPase domain-containing protein n=1 Tax=Zymoseptoria tritici (strain ST99CH_3D7) TaxID=1276538 RepID=A0A1X7S1E7_ZYMT9|nr:unnamed protein product [Zymoseptoria tritici ST99CH_3D7]
MDFRKLAKALPVANESTNGTEPFGLTDLPGSILETLVPGYGLISRYISSAFGIDISIFVSTGLILFAAVKAGQLVFEYLSNAFTRAFVSSVYIDEHDDLFDMVMGWLADNQRTKSRRTVRAVTQRGSKVEETMDDSQETGLTDGAIFDYNKWSARIPPRYEPYYGRNLLWFQGRPFYIQRSRKPQSSRVQVSFSSVEDDLIQIDCLGRNTDPIKEMLKMIKINSLEKLQNTTTIRHPTPKDRARYGGSWSKTFSRPSRPMETVILDDVQKRTIITDMNEFLHPSSPKWYATRGIPYRRGYLFHGPPGTGKTSLSFALAGIFGLEIYAISLQEPTLTEGDLLQLFNGLPRRCIVLLEDVDAAGLLRDSKSDEKDKKKSKKTKAEDEKNTESEKSKREAEYTLKDLAKELKSISTPKSKNSNNDSNQNNTGHPNRAPGTGISLSGLLNAIDGVATQEGRVLIMTTNHPEKLDAALVRPGRVDRRVEFNLAKRDQISELFVRMYAGDDQTSKANRQSNSVLTNGHAKQGNGSLLRKPSHVQGTGLTDVELQQLADEFAGHIPDDTFTPAELQNLLMRHKKEPKAAVDRADAWVKELFAEKEKAKKEKQEAESDDDDE